MYIYYLLKGFSGIVGVLITFCAAIFGTVWGLRRLLRAKKRFVNLLESNSFKSKTKMNEELLKNIQITYAPIAFMKTCGILFPLFLVLSVLAQLINIYSAIALAGTVEFTLFAAGIPEALLIHSMTLFIIIYTWTVYYLLKHISRKIRIDIMTLFNGETKDNIEI
jgi:hypothetical protein